MHAFNRSSKLRQCRRPRAAYMDRHTIGWFHAAAGAGGRTFARLFRKWNGFRVPVRQRRAGSGGQRQRPKQPPWLKFHRSGSRMQPEIMFFKLSRPIHRAMKAVRIQSGSILGIWNRSRRKYPKPRLPPQLAPLIPVHQATQHLRSTPTPTVVAVPAHNTRSRLHFRKVKARRLTAVIKLKRAGGGCCGRTGPIVGFQIRPARPAVLRGTCNWSTLRHHRLLSFRLIPILPHRQCKPRPTRREI